MVAGSSVDILLELPGVVAAAEFSADGSVVDFKGDLDLLPPANQVATRLAARVSETFDQLASTYSSLSQMQWTPRRCWMYSGGDWTVVVGGNRLYLRVRMTLISIRCLRP
jgi:roadblock/LC7 domain-containing protein